MSAEKPEGPEGAKKNPETAEIVEENTEGLKTQQEDPSEVANPEDNTVPTNVNDSKGPDEEDIKVEDNANEESPDISKEDDDGKVMGKKKENGEESGTDVENEKGEYSAQQMPKIQEKQKKTTSPRTKTSVESSQGLPYMRSSVILSLEEAKEKVTVISQKITNLKNQILEHEQKGLLTDEDLKHMKLIQAELMDNLSLCNLTSKYICGLIGIEQASSSHLDMSLSPIPRKGVMSKNDKTTSGTVQKIVGRKEKATLGPPIPGIREVDDIYLERYSEEKLPKVIVCDVGSIDKVPRIFVCEPIKKNDLQPFHQPKNFETGQSRDFGKTQAVSHLSKPHNLERNSIREPLAPDSYNQPLYNNQQSKASSKPQYPTGSRKIHPEPNNDVQYFQNLVHKMETTIESLRKENIELQRKAQYNSQPPQPKICRRLLSQKVRQTLLPHFER
uniref:Uncharacterized protein n=2 Tax=Clastoptera arizonana TaxID=38151 RepID=A0A1B6E9L3_9HEMI